jgi:predicted secreted Zn-dependent protease
MAVRSNKFWPCGCREPDDLKRWAMAAALILAMLPSIAQSEVRISKKTTYYTIRADTREEFYAVVSQLPKGSIPATRKLARIQTRAWLEVVPQRMASGKCRFGRVAFRLNITIMLPRLRTRSRSLRRRWGPYYARVRRHEDHHARITEKYLRRMDRALRAMRSRNCATLKVRGESVIKKYQSAMDRENQALEISYKLPF